MASVVLLGTLDTKGEEYRWLRDRLRRYAVEVVIVDTGVAGDPLIPADIPRAEVARAAGEDLERLRATGDRGIAVTAMARGAAEVMVRLHAEGRVDGVLAVGGSGGTSIASRAMRELPLGIPKLMVSSMAAGDVSPYVGSADITMMHSVVDIAGVNRVSEPILANAAAGIAGMAKEFAATGRALTDVGSGDGRPLVAASMAGVTTPGVDAARRRLTELGYEVLVFHTSGSGGRSLEALAGQGVFAGVLDLTPCELADDLFGGLLSAGPDRLEAAGRAGIPQVVSLGALDMIKFGPPESVPERYRDRHVRVHNPSITVVRTTPAEVAELGRVIATKLRTATGPTALCLPLHGLSTLSAPPSPSGPRPPDAPAPDTAPAAPGSPAGPYHEPETDAALFSVLREGLRGSAVEIHELDTHINSAAFGRAVAERLHALIESRSAGTDRATA